MYFSVTWRIPSHPGRGGWPCCSSMGIRPGGVRRRVLRPGQVDAGGEIGRGLLVADPSDSGAAAGGPGGGDGLDGRAREKGNGERARPPRSPATARRSPSSADRSNCPVCPRRARTRRSATDEPQRSPPSVGLDRGHHLLTALLLDARPHRRAGLRAAASTLTEPGIINRVPSSRRTVLPAGSTLLICLLTSVFATGTGGSRHRSQSGLAPTSGRTRA